VFSDGIRTAKGMGKQKKNKQNKKKKNKKKGGVKRTKVAQSSGYKKEVGGRTATRVRESEDKGNSRRGEMIASTSRGCVKKQNGKGGEEQRGHSQTSSGRKPKHHFF